jgi:hypothetical protein
MRFNRVEGFFFGSKASLDTLLGVIKVHGKVGYGFSDKRIKYTVGTTIYPFRTRMIGIGMERYQSLGHTPDNQIYGTFEISLAALLKKED